MAHQFTLEPYSTKASRYTCPSCQDKHSFSRYINILTGGHLHPNVGKCNHDGSCGYHYKPKQYFTENKVLFDPTLITLPTRKIKMIEKIGYIPIELLEQSVQHPSHNVFVKFLVGTFGHEVFHQLLEKYYIGSSNKCYRKETGYWHGATVFWFIDINDQVRAGQVKLFDEKGHTVKYLMEDGNKQSCTDFIHTPLIQEYKRKKEELPEWLKDYKESKKITCLFGEHLLQDTTKHVAVVEAPKTAIIASVYFPKFIWVAVGALSFLTAERCQVLQGREVVLFPDLSMPQPGHLSSFEKWKNKAKEFSSIANFKVSDLLELNATAEERKRGLDLADYLLKFNLEDFNNLKVNKGKI